jgi:hypothetical protein
MNARPILATPCDGACPTAPARPVQADSKKNGESSVLVNCVPGGVPDVRGGAPMKWFLTCTAVALALTGPLVPSERGVVRRMSWKAPGAPTGRFRFCVESWDESGNQGDPSCAPLRLK